MKNFRVHVKDFLSSSEWRWPVLMLAVAFFFLGLFYWDYSSVEGESGEDVVGKIIYKNNVVQRRNMKGSVWSRVELNADLRNNDIIRAQKGSEAMIELKDGTRIDVDEDSMFKVDLSKDGTILDLDEGSIKVRKFGKDNKNVVVRSGDKAVTFQDSDVLIQSSGQQAGGLDVRVEEGEASLQAGREVHSLKKAQQAHLTSEGAAIRDLSVILQEPAAHAVLLLNNEEKRAVTFRWQSRVPRRAATLQVAHDSKFRNPLLVGDSSDGILTVRLPEGSYYWRVLLSDDRQEHSELSFSRKLTLVSHKAVQLLSPLEEELITYVKFLPQVRFSWTESPLVESYLLEVASNRQFIGEDYRQFRLKAPTFSIKELAKGRYYWRVKSLFSLKNIPEKDSAVHSFHIEQVADYAGATLQTPSVGEKIDPAEVASKGILFSWNASRELKQFQFELDNSASFQNPVLSMNVERSYTVVKRRLPDGLYYWRVQGREAGRSKGSFSVVANFSIQERAAEEKMEEEDDKKYSDRKYRPSRKAPDREENLQRKIRRYDLAQYRQHLAQLSYDCRKNGLPDILIRECFPSHLTLNISDGYRRDLYAFIRLQSRNNNERAQSYLYFQENCSPSFPAIVELLQKRKKNYRFQALMERSMIEKSLLRLQTCRGG